jgi:predicted PurR-regulated permease PerM
MQASRGTHALTAHAVVDIALRLALVAILAYACYRIARPFVTMLLWTALLAVMLYPLHAWLRKHRGIGNAASAVVIGIAGTMLVLVPILFATDSLLRSALRIVAYVNEYGIAMPERPAWLERIPLIGKPLRERWDAAATDMPAALQQYRPQIRDLADWLGSFAAGLAGGLATALAALILASVLLAYGDQAHGFASALAARVTGDRPRARLLIALTASTIRSVVQGIVGVAFVQAVLVGIGFFMVGLSFAGALSLLALVMGILQIPVALMTVPAIIYVFMHEPTSTAVIFAVWTGIAGMSDNLLRPFMLGRGLDVPMPLILIGVIGGLIVDGMIGLFTGPVILAVGHVLFTEWLGEQETE